MVWGAFFSTTKLPLVFLPPKEKKETDFIENVYKPMLIPFLKQDGPERKKNLVLMEDNAPIHTAKICSDFQNTEKINKITNWPPQSPDLNPIKNVWKVLKTNVQTLYNPKSVKEMQEVLKLAWDNFPQSTLRKIVNSMPEQMEEVIKKGGGPTRW
jgi:transposase